MLSKNVSKYEFLTSKDVLSEKDLLEKAATSKKIWIFPIRSRIKTPDSNCKEKMSGIRQAFISVKDDKNEKKNKKTKEKI